MVFKHLNQIIFQRGSSIKEVLERFNKTATHTESKGFALVVDKKGKCLGVVSEGDIRRKLLENISINSSIEIAMNKDFTLVKYESLCKSISDSDYSVKKISYKLLENGD